MLRNVKEIKIMTLNVQFFPTSTLKPIESRLHRYFNQLVGRVSGNTPPPLLYERSFFFIIGDDIIISKNGFNAGFV